MRIQLKNIHRIKTKYGVYYYHRPTKKRLLAEYGTQQFIDEVAALNRKLELTENEARGTLGELMNAYERSPEFSDLAERTKQDYRKIITYLGPLRPMALIEIDSPFVIELRDKTFELKKRAFTNYLIAFLRLLFNWGIPRGFSKLNPVTAVPKIKRPRDARQVNRPWLPHELQAVMQAASQPIRIAVALGAYTAMREADVLRLQFNSYNGDSIEMTQGKTRARLTIPVIEPLRVVLEESIASAKERATPSTLFVVSENGTGFTGDGFRSSLFRLIRRLVKEGKVGKGLTFHGLRHTTATALADAGCDDRDIMAVTGHTSEASVRRYTKRADQKRRANKAMQKLQMV